jgi:hypothetical protein
MVASAGVIEAATGADPKLRFQVQARLVAVRFEFRVFLAWHN